MNDEYSIECSDTQRLSMLTVAHHDFCLLIGGSSWEDGWAGDKDAATGGGPLLAFFILCQFNASIAALAAAAAAFALAACAIAY